LTLIVVVLDTTLAPIDITLVLAKNKPVLNEPDVILADDVAFSTFIDELVIFVLTVVLLCVIIVLVLLNVLEVVFPMDNDVGVKVDKEVLLDTNMFITLDVAFVTLTLLLMFKFADKPFTFPPRSTSPTTIVFEPNVPHNCEVRATLVLPVFAYVVFAVIISVDNEYRRLLSFNRAISHVSTIISVFDVFLDISL